jgi:predicted Rossmann fold flavoprotein
MMAAGIAAAGGAAVTLLERNEKLGKKLYITGKGRCNITNAADRDGLLKNVMSDARFMLSAFSAFGSGDLISFFEKNGVALKIERGQRVFPVSDKASDVIKALENFIRSNGVKVLLNQRVESVEHNSEYEPAFSVKTERGMLKADTVIIATGGLSYKSTGSTGDGYGFAASFNHTLTPAYPSLVPLYVSEPWVAEVAGLSLKNVRCSAFTEPRAGRKHTGKPVYSEIGEMLFTPKGVTGPLILTASRYLTEFLPVTGNGGTDMMQFPYLSVDLKPGLSFDELDERIRRDFNENINKDFVNALDKLLPQRLIGVIINLSGVNPERKVNTITKPERLSLDSLIKDLRLTPTDTAGYAEAVITMGGVSVKEINPSSMMSKKVEGLFFAGEVLDVDALTGGFNLQAAFSTGYLAGKSAAEMSRFNFTKWEE